MIKQICEKIENDLKSPEQQKVLIEMNISAKMTLFNK